MEPFYTTIEVQIRNDNTFGLLYQDFREEAGQTLDAKTRAEAKVFAIWQAAATSDIPYHAGYILRSDGIVTEGRVYDRRTATE